MITEDAISKLELKPSDIIIIKGDWPQEAVEEIATKTKHFVVWLDGNSTFETMSREDFLAIFAAYKEHRDAGGK